MSDGVKFKAARHALVAGAARVRAAAAIGAARVCALHYRAALMATLRFLATPLSGLAAFSILTSQQEIKEPVP